MQTKIIAVVVALVVVAGGAYAYTSLSGTSDTMMKDDSLMQHDDAAMMKGDDAMMKDDSAMVHDDTMMKGDMMASTSEGAMMH